MSLVVRIIFVTVAFALGSRPNASQTWSTVDNKTPLTPTLPKSVCDEKATDPPTDALRLVCQRGSVSRKLPEVVSAETIVIGFVGGFVKADDTRHPEVLFASYLREHYTSVASVKVFANRDGKAAMSYVMGRLDTNHDGFVSAEERKHARIIIYGHSWGASETVALARALQRVGIPVLLTIQLDIIPKFHQDPTLIPSNVAKAINFYQSKGPIHGRSHIVAVNPALTTILGNLRMDYDSGAINCDNYNWVVRTFNRPHHEIENDPRVWSQVAELVDTNLSTE